jgi:hypothetical protein
MAEECGSRGEDGWLADELRNSTLPDQRLIRRLGQIVDHLAASPGQPVPAACQDWAATKAAYRFFDNDRVTEQGVLAGHFAATRKRFAATTGTVLVLQDTTEFIYKRNKPEKIGFTKAINSGRDREGRLREHTLCGLLMHSSLAVTTDGVPLGLAAVKFWTRSKFKGTAALKRKINPTRVPIETKESYRWLENLRQSCGLFGDPGRCVHVGDRESDIYELFCLAHNLGTFFLVRVQTDRLTQLPEDVAGDVHKGKVYQRLEALPWAGRHTIQIGGETAQPNTVSLKVKFSEIDTMPPIGKQKAYKPQKLVYIHALEEEEPENRPRIDWRLVTNLPVTTLAEAIEKLSWYARRWKIEVFHKVMKSGCKAEDAKLRTAERLVKLLAVLAVVSWRVFWITMSGRTNPEAPPETALTPAEISILDRVIPPSPAPKPATLASYVDRLARLGGYLNRAHDPPPGNIVMWRGISRLNDIALGFRIAADLVGN